MAWDLGSPWLSGLCFFEPENLSGLFLCGFFLYLQHSFPLMQLSPGSPSPVIFQVSELLQSREKPSLDTVIYFERETSFFLFWIRMTLLLHLLLRVWLLCLTVNSRDLSALLTGAPHGPNRTLRTEVVLNARSLSGASSSSQHLCRVNITILNFCNWNIQRLYETMKLVNRVAR